MKFSIAKSPKAKLMELCTLEKFKQYTQSGNTIDLCRRIAEVETYLTIHSDEKDSEEYKAKEQEKSRLKAMLPVITWQAYFPNEKRKSNEAECSGLFMIDVDHIENARALYEEKVKHQIEELGIVYAGMTPSTHGLRVVARLIEGTSTLEENQKFLAEKLGLEIDEVCKDFARCSFMVPEDYIFYMDEGVIYEAGSPEQIFDHPEKKNTRIFVNLIRECRHTITEDNDYYGMVGVFLNFCLHNGFSCTTTDNVQHIIEEVLLVVGDTAGTEIVLTYSEKTSETEISFEHLPTIDKDILNLEENQLQAAIIRNSSKSITIEQNRMNLIVR